MNAAVVETARGEFLLLEVSLPGRAAEAAGVLLYEAAGNLLDVRMRRDWDQIAEPEEGEVLELVERDLRDKIAEMGAGGVLGYIEETLSNSLRVSERQPVLIAGGFQATLNRLYRQFVASRVQPYKTHLPVYSCRAAAGRWGEQQEVEEEGWIEAPADLRLIEEMFVAQVRGRSMEPEIPDGAWCVFRAGVTGSRQGRRVLVENFSESETGGQRYTIKRYTSKKKHAEDGSWQHEVIRLEPLNPEFEAWEIEEDSRVRVLAELVRVLD
ncbi:MAG: S24 family peptidase [Acidimicrobiia bacterium]|nr:S24 family peptidase [Acidimicrobiia bacterium]